MKAAGATRMNLVLMEVEVHLSGTKKRNKNASRGCRNVDRCWKNTIGGEIDEWPGLDIHKMPEPP